MSTLYEITIAQQDLINDIEFMEGELTPQMEKSLEINQSNINQKSIAYLEVITKKESFNATIDDEIKRLQAIKKRNDNLVGRLKDNLLVAVKAFGEFEVGTHKFSTRKSTRIEIEGLANYLPDRFQTKKLTITADKAELKKAIKEGEEIKDVKLVEVLNLKIS